jgi:hypothetical protein
VAIKVYGQFRFWWVKQIFVTCPSHVVAADCVPRCEPETNGDLLLLNMDGDDTKLTCELHQTFFSWVGSSADGGYYGSDANTFFAAVSTGAAGTYVLDLGADADFRAKLVIGLGQSVVITGDRSLPAPLAWGTGSFEVKEGGALAMSYLALSVSAITLDAGARAVALTDCALNFVAESAFTGDGAVAGGTSNTCPEVPPSENNDPNIVYDSADPLRRTTATVSCDGGRGAGTVVADPAVARACHTDGSWSMVNPSCEPCCCSISNCIKHPWVVGEQCSPACTGSGTDCRRRFNAPSCASGCNDIGCCSSDCCDIAC